MYVSCGCLSVNLICRPSALPVLSVCNNTTSGQEMEARKVEKKLCVCVCVYVCVCVLCKLCVLCVCVLCVCVVCVYVCVCVVCVLCVCMCLCVVCACERFV